MFLPYIRLFPFSVCVCVCLGYGCCLRGCHRCHLLLSFYFLLLSLSLCTKFDADDDVLSIGVLIFSLSFAFYLYANQVNSTVRVNGFTQFSRRCRCCCRCRCHNFFPLRFLLSFFSRPIIKRFCITWNVRHIFESISTTFESDATNELSTHTKTTTNLFIFQCLLIFFFVHRQVDYKQDLRQFHSHPCILSGFFSAQIGFFFPFWW